MPAHISLNSWTFMNEKPWDVMLVGVCVYASVHISILDTQCTSGTYERTCIRRPIYL